MILLDTNIVAGLFDPSGNSNISKQFKEALSKLLANTRDSLIIAPTPVCFELMKFTQPWFDFVTTSKRLCFRYCHYAIADDVKTVAAKYLLKINPKQGKPGEKLKVSDMDALIAAYSFLFTADIVTCNQSDFDVNYFDAVRAEVAFNTKKRVRDTIYLLRPKPDWKEKLHK